MRNIPFGKPIIGEQEKNSVANVLEGSIFVHGVKMKEFESAFAIYAKAPFALTVSSCTAALHLSYFYRGITKGDEVIVPAQTHTATVHAVELCGAKPVFVDSEEKTGNIDIDQIESAITENTKALSVVHYLGMPVNMDKIMAIAKKYGLFVVEDCALAIGTYFKGIHAGLYGDTGCFSFYPVKHMTTAEGGMLITKDENIALKIAKQRAFGVDRHVGERKVPGHYDVDMLGFNYRMNEIEAALGIEQLKRVDGFLSKRKENYESLSSRLGGVDEIKLFKSTYGDYQSSYYCLSILLSEPLVPKRSEIIQSLKQKGIGTSIYYPQAVPHFTYYKNKYGYTDSDFPVASSISRSSIALPVGPHLNIEDTDYIAGMVKSIIKEVK
ncbi:MAG: DegT/DnrJ/EryC1/StrS family aminotransferase [bacterium]